MSDDIEMEIPKDSGKLAVPKGNETPSASSAAALEEASPEGETASNHEPKVIGSWFEQLREHVTGSYLNALYIFVPIAFAAKYMPLSQPLLFATSFLGLIPLAAALGDFTEDLAMRTNDAIGALINVTFGNATELIISIVALQAKQYELIKNSLVGSVLGNMLLVLGSAFVMGGRKDTIIKFNAAAAQTYMSSLVFACFGFIVPTSFFALNNNSGDPHFALSISREISLLMVGTYALYIWFQLKTHASLFEGADDDEEEEEPNFSFEFALVAIGVVAVLISMLSDFLVATIEPFAETFQVSEYFIGLVLVPIVGNVAEHASAIIMAAKGKHDIALGIALGSSIQIGMMVMPLMTFVAWVLGHPLNMNINSFTCATLFAGVILTYTVVSNGEANYLTGTKMLMAYIMLIIAFLNAPDPGDPIRAALTGAPSPAPSTGSPWSSIGSLVPGPTAGPGYQI